MSTNLGEKHYDDGPQVFSLDDGLQTHDLSSGLEVRDEDAANTKKPSLDYKHAAGEKIVSPEHNEKEFYHTNVRGTGSGRTTSKTTNKTTGRMSGGLKGITPNLHKMYIVVVLALLVVGTALGVGLGIGLKKGSNSTSDASNTGSSPGSTTGGTQPASNSSSSGGSITKSSSIAAIMTSDGQRQIFYQSNNGSVNQASSEMGSWSSSVVVPSARNNTPISAIVAGSNTIVFYTTTDNKLQYSLYTTSQGWNGPIDTGHSLAETSTSMSVTPVTCKDSTSGIVLIFEGADRVYGYYGSDENPSAIKWTDFSAGLLSQSWWSSLSSPMVTGNSYLDKGLTLNAFFFNRQSLTDSTVNIVREVAFSNFSTCQISAASNYTSTALSDDLQGLTAQNDLVMFPLLQYPWYVIDGKFLSVNGPGGLDTLNTSFPYLRLASINSTASINLYLYNQLNESTFLEHIAVNRGAWTTNYISLPAS